jgi:hypothetical protein
MSKNFKSIFLYYKLFSSLKIQIENLSKTYVNYPKTISVLDGLIQDYAITTYKLLLEYIPKDKLSKDLRENVTYNGVLVYQGYDENQRVDSIDLNNSNNIDEI